jgi:RNA polymerase sigma-70 factor (sigma-E family)
MRDRAAEEEYVEYVRGRIPALRRVAYALCGDEHRADDVVQQAITKLYVHWERARTASNLHKYTHTLLVRVFLDERRLHWSRVRLFGSLPEPPPVEPEGVEDRHLLRAALARLPRRQRAVLVLRFLCDLPVDEVAEVLGCSAGTVKSQTSHGLASLRRLMAGTAAGRAAWSTQGK